MATKDVVTKVWIEPGCIVCDACENTAPTVFELMLELARDHGTAFVLVTHDPSLAARCQRTLELGR